jgi:hypothetical protein
VKQIITSLETDVAQTVAQEFEIGYALHEAIRVGRASARYIPNNPHVLKGGLEVKMARSTTNNVARLVKSTKLGMDVSGLFETLLCQEVNHVIMI